MRTLRPVRRRADPAARSAGAGSGIDDCGVRRQRELEHLDGLVEALQLAHPERCERVLAGTAEHHCHDRGGEHLIARRRVTGAETRRLDDGPAVPVVAVVDRLSRTQPDAHERMPRIAAAGPVGGLLDRLRAPDRIHGAREHRHHTVADVLDDGSAMVFDRVARGFAMRALDLVGGLRALPQQLGRADEVREHHRHGRRRSVHVLRSRKDVSLRRFVICVIHKDAMHLPWFLNIGP